MRGWFHCRVVACIALALLALSGAGNSAAQVSVAPPAAATVIAPPAGGTVNAPPAISGSDYFATTPQLADPLRPLAKLSSARARVRAIVATIPDPNETHLGRSFDMALAATIGGFQSQNYVLNGYAFPWKPLAPLKPGAQEENDSTDKRMYRRTPGVLVFRRDTWRSPLAIDAVPDYALVFLVGESPSYGVQRGAFDIAARCVINLDADGPVPVATLRIEQRCDTKPEAARAVMLDVLGPSFSGSMQSLALAIQALRNDDSLGPIDMLLLSASTTVSSNRNIDKLATADPDQLRSRGTTTYVPLAWSLWDQYLALRSYLCTLPASAGQRKMVILAEQSSFGQDVEQFTKLEERGNIGCAGESVPRPLNVDVRTFPPDIASIRAEHSIRRVADEPQVPGMPRAR